MLLASLAFIAEIRSLAFLLIRRVRGIAKGCRGQATLLVLICNVVEVCVLPRVGDGGK